MTDYRTQQGDGAVTHNEEPAFPALAAVNLKREAFSIEETYKNFVVLNVNNHCVRMAVMQGEFRWHQHPRSDECFLVLEGELEIDLADGRTFRLKPRTVNLCFEGLNAYTDVVFEDPGPATRK
jgi:mannose-6-phosphate isomerase-like protein (cupin superfamily)